MYVQLSKVRVSRVSSKFKLISAILWQNQIFWAILHINGSNSLFSNWLSSILQCVQVQVVWYVANFGLESQRRKEFAHETDLTLFFDLHSSVLEVTGLVEMIKYCIYDAILPSYIPTSLPIYMYECIELWSCELDC